MTARSKKSPPVAPASPPKGRSASAGAAAPLTMEEQLHRIETMGKRIEGYIRFVCQIASQGGTSKEIKEKAVFAFYKQMLLVEGQLGQIHDELRLE